MTSSDTQEAMRKLIYANHILHKHGAVDGFGFVAVRHPEKPDIYVISGYGPPALVESSEDLHEYHIKDSTPVDPNAGKGYSERFIMGALFQRFPQIQAAVHSHANEVLPYCCSDVPLQPVFHMGGFLGQTVPVWDIRKLYDDADPHRQDMLVNNTTLGASLATAFSRNPDDGDNGLDYNVVLQSRHGFTTHGPDIETAVYRALYTKTNASIQTESILLQAGASKLAGDENAVSVSGLADRHATDCGKMNEATQDKAWKLWVKQVQVDPLYTNRMDQ